MELNKPEYEGLPMTAKVALEIAGRMKRNRIKPILIEDVPHYLLTPQGIKGAE